MSKERQLMIGVSRADITPPIGAKLRGGPGRVSERVIEPLCATALVLSDGVTVASLVTCDLLDLSTPFVSEATMEIEERTAIPAENILLSCTHNHAGPVLDDSYAETLKVALSACVGEARSGMQPGRVGAGKGVVENVAVSQRERTPEGQTSVFGNTANGDNFEATIDTEVGVVRFDDLNGRPLAGVVSYSCHPDTSPVDDTTIRAQYPGEVRRIFELATGATCMFTQGCCGNTGLIGRWFQMPYELAREESYDMTRRAGRKIAGEALKAFENIDTRAREVRRVFADNRRFDRIYEEVDIPPVTNLGVRSKTFSASPLDDADEVRSAEIRVIAVNDIALVGIPGDAYVEIALEIKQRSNAEHTLVLGFSNGMLSYIPMSSAYRDGGYSVAAAKNANVGPGTAQIVIETALELIGELV